MTRPLLSGAGLNVLNAPPIASLAQLLPQEARSRLSLEKTVATIMAIFEPMWGTFITERGSFRPFRDQYLDRWLHSYVDTDIFEPTRHTYLCIT